MKGEKLTKAQQAEQKRIAEGYAEIHREQLARRGLDGRTGRAALRSLAGTLEATEIFSHDLPR